MTEELLIGETKLTAFDVVEVARNYRKVSLGKKALERVILCREVVESLHQKGVKVYGITTGFASHRDRVIDPKESARLSSNLIKSHSCGFGNPFPEDVVRAAMLVRAHALALGNSGVRPEVIQVLLDMLNFRIYPYVPEQGSCGSSGDLLPLSHLALVAIGDPHGRLHKRLLGATNFATDGDEFHIYMAGRRTASEYVAVPHSEDFIPLTKEIKSKLPFQTIELAAKEGLACNNGAVFSAVIACLTLYDAQNFMDSSDMVAAMSYEALQAVPDCLNEGILSCRPHPGHLTSARNIRSALSNSHLVLENVACGFNMARYNRAIVELHQLCHKPDVPEDAKSRLTLLLERMKSLQKNVWKEVEKARTESSSNNARINELDACARVFLPILQDWESLLGWSNQRQELHARCREKPLLERNQAELEETHSTEMTARLSAISEMNLEEKKEETCEKPAEKNFAKAGDENCTDQTSKNCTDQTSKNCTDQSRANQSAKSESEKEIFIRLKKKLAGIYFSHVRKVVRIDAGPDVQDNYSFRAAATVHGAARDAVERCRQTVEIEINSATDNPLILLDNILSLYWKDVQKPSQTPENPNPENQKNTQNGQNEQNEQCDSRKQASEQKIAEQALPDKALFHDWIVQRWDFVTNEVKSGANFHGEPVGMVSDHLGAALTEVSNISERRSALLIDENHSKGLPSCLVWNPGINSGFLIPQYSAASMVTENKLLSVPSTTDSIPTGEGCEDYVSMSTTAARRCFQVLVNAERILAIELINAYQGIQFRKPAQLGQKTRTLENLIASELGPMILKLNGWLEEEKDVASGLSQMRMSLAQIGLADTALDAIRPCILNDITFYPLLEAVAYIIRQGKVSKILQSED